MDSQYTLKTPEEQKIRFIATNSRACLIGEDIRDLEKGSESCWSFLSKEGKIISSCTSNQWEQTTVLASPPGSSITTHSTLGSTTSSCFSAYWQGCLFGVGSENEKFCGKFGFWYRWLCCLGCVIQHIAWVRCICIRWGRWTLLPAPRKIDSVSLWGSRGGLCNAHKANPQTILCLKCSYQNISGS